jgi:hypothetical protein
MVITELNKESFAIIRKEVAYQLKSLEVKLGVKLSPGKISYSEGAFTMKLEGSLVQCKSGKSGKSVEFEHLAILLGIPATWFGKKIKTTHGTATISEIKTKNSKFPIIAELDDGRRVKLPVDFVKFQLKQATA